MAAKIAEERRSFPMLSPSHWWALRRKFKQSIPGTVTTSYLATVLGMQEQSARNNILPYLRDVRIVDDEGKPLERARKWRDDTEYRTLCDEIAREVYPEELLDSAPDPIADRQPAERWFAGRTGAGQSAVRKMTNFCQLLKDADHAKESEPRRDDQGKKSERAPRSSTAPLKEKRRAKSNGSAKASSEPEQFSRKPEVQINLQIYFFRCDARSD